MRNVGNNSFSFVSLECSTGFVFVGRNLSVLFHFFKKKKKKKSGALNLRDLKTKKIQRKRSLGRLKTFNNKTVKNIN